MKLGTRTRIFFLTLIGILILAGGAFAQTPDPADIVLPDNWVGTYTPEEIAAIERALWSANLTLEDLNFRKDFTYGYECFPIVKEWMAHPMDIAPGMDKMVADMSEAEVDFPASIGDFLVAAGYYPAVTEDGLTELWTLTTETNSMETSSAPGTIEELEAVLTTMLENGVSQPIDESECQLIRQYAPVNLTWHDVFESPYTDEQVTEWDAMLLEKNDEYIYELMSKVDMFSLSKQYISLCPDPAVLLKNLPPSAFPMANKIIIETEYGRIGIGSRMSDYWEGDFAILIDPGGNDTYHNCRIGAAYGTEGNRYGYFVDMGGDDFYDCGDVDITIGAAILGVAAFYDLGQGNDRYITGSCALGASMCGIATFYDDGGSDTYESKVYSQGAAGFGIGIMVDDSLQDPPVMSTDEGTADPVDIGQFDNDHYYAWTNSQAFARTLGVAICSNKRGNDVYEAGGVYLDAPLFADRYQSFSQGFAIGERGIDYAGGIALILDYEGNDRYLGDIYNQGVGYWYSAGFIYDCAGNDTYEMTQYGQGSGIHLAVGGLVDVSGSDSYTMHIGLGTGGSHDYAASVFHDRGGNDQYFGYSACNGGSLTNSAVIFIDRSGDDTYAARRDGGINFGRPARGFTSIGVLVDLDGQDDYLGVMDNNAMWTQDQVGVGIDTAPPPVPEGEEAPVAADRGGLGENVPLPEIISYEGELTQEVFDELWAISVRWEVGDNRFIVPKARERLVAFGPAVLPYVSGEFDNNQSGLAFGSYDMILKYFLDTDHDAVINVVRENLMSDEEMRRRDALAEIATLKLTDLEQDVAAILDDPDPAMQRRAIGVLGAIGSHVADERIIQNLTVIDDEALVKVSMDTLFMLDVYCYDQLRPLLDHPYISVRESLIGQLALNSDIYAITNNPDLDPAIKELKLANATAYIADLCEDLCLWPGQMASGLGIPELSTRAFRSLLEVFATGKIPPDQQTVAAISNLLSNEDWGVRADAVKVVNHWNVMSIKPEPVEEVETSTDATETEAVTEPLLEPNYAGIADIIESLLDHLDGMRLTETDPYVLFVLGEE
ncbi:MAG: HEAT repeat domain-containing protein [bacterium]|nr:HEAT repeat domain-containing protein [bacterium]